MSVEVQESQSAFLMRGGTYALALAYLRKDGTLPKERAYNEYPKLIRLPKGEPRSVKKSTMTCDKQILQWTEEVQEYDDFLAADEGEEERILSGGKTNAQIEDERQRLIMRSKAAGIQTDPNWSAVRLRRELGDKLDAPEPVDRLGALEAELNNLRKIAAMQAEIEALKSQIAKPADDIEDLRGQLVALGVKVDGRWNIQRCRDELDRATAP